MTENRNVLIVAMNRLLRFSRLHEHRCTLST